MCISEQIFISFSWLCTIFLFLLSREKSTLNFVYVEQQISSSQLGIIKDSIIDVERSFQCQKEISFHSRWIAVQLWTFHFLHGFERNQVSKKIPYFLATGANSKLIYTLTRNLSLSRLFALVKKKKKHWRGIACKMKRYKLFKNLLREQIRGIKKVLLMFL